MRDKQVFIVNVQKSLLTRTVTMEGYVYSLSYSPDGRFLCVVTNQSLSLIDPETGEIIKEIGYNNGRPKYSFSDNGKSLVVAHVPPLSNVTVYDTDSWGVVFSRNKTAAKRSSVSISADGKKLLFGLSDCRLELWNLDLLD